MSDYFRQLAIAVLCLAIVWLIVTLQVSLVIQELKTNGFVQQNITVDGDDLL